MPIIAPSRSEIARLLLVVGTAFGLLAPVAALGSDDPADEPASAIAGADDPADPNDGMQDQPADSPAAPPAAAPPAGHFDARGRRVQSDELTVLAFKNVSLDQVIPFIVEATGKVVLPQPDVLARRITILNDREIPRSKALDLVFLALQQNGVAVVETPDLIVLRDIAEIDRQDVPVIGPAETVLGRTDTGSIVEKIFALRHGSAPNMQEMLKGSLPSFAKMTVDADSNQIIIMGNIGLLQRLERLITSLDQPAAASLSSETFHLRFADAEQIAQNVRDLYAQTQNNQQNRNAGNPFAGFQQQQQQRGNQGGANQRQQGGGNNRQTGDVQTSQNLRVTANTQQNSVTVLAERSVLDEIRHQIMDNWDIPLDKDVMVPKVYDLKNSDPVKVKDTLVTLFGNPGSTTQAGQQANRTGANRLYGQFSFDAIPEAGRLVVIARSPENLAAIDEIIQKLDSPQTAGLPQIVELKHANAEELAEQLNTLLSQDGTLAQITRQESGLNDSTSSSSPFASNQTSTSTTNQNQQNQQTTPGTITFWWQRSRPPTNASGSSNLISKIRIVPVWRQNSLMVLAPPEYQNSLVSVIEQLDRPGRQVLLSAVVAEIALDDALSLGLRWSSTPITPSKQDNTLSIGANTAGEQAGGVITGTKNNLLPNLFDTSVLNVGVNLNVLLQALAEKTSINILSEPRIFTSDNQEAEFFSGQDIPFITDSQTSDTGSITQSFDYKAVGVSLRVRPRITIKRDVDLRINVELSSIQPNQTLFGGFIVDRRETTTHLIVKDGQTVVLSGIIRTEESDVTRKVPLLGDIPLLGYLFTSVEKSKTKTELVAFITPFVVGSAEEVDILDSPDRARLQELRKQMRPAEELDKVKGGKGSFEPPEAQPANTPQP